MIEENLILLVKSKRGHIHWELIQRTMVDKWWTSTDTEFDDWITAGLKVKKGNSREEAGITGNIFAVYDEVTRKYTTQKTVEISRLSYKECTRGNNIFHDAFFKHDQ